MRTPLIAGNWKMHKTVAEAVELARSLVPLVDAVEGVEVAVAPPYTALHAVGKLLRAGAAVNLAAQNVHEEEHGAFTGEVSVSMLQDVGVSMVILGHSERRQYFGETDQAVGRKAAKVVAGGLVPIVCVGESLEQREAGEAFRVVERQLRAALEPLHGAELEQVVVAYEPVWAIGTGRTATKEQVQEMHAHIRRLLAEIAGLDQAQNERILYGGSVKPANIAELMDQPDVDGALVGGASLDAETFASIVRFRV
jgi:triosephosphate isomerase